MSAKPGKKRMVSIGVAIVISFAVIVLILAFTVFKTKHAVITVNSVTFEGIKAGFNISELNIDLNVSVNMDLCVKNPNHVSFRYNNSTAFLYYRGTLVGEADIPAGGIGSGKTVGMNVTLKVLADQLLMNSAIYSDFLSGKITVQTSTVISGRVTILKFFKHHLVSYSYCDVLIGIQNRTIQNSSCRYKNRF